MDAALAFALRAVAIGTGATLVLDAWALVLARAYGVRPADWALVGRWVGHWRRGRFAHQAIAAAAPVRGERWLGWAFHYATGVVFAAVLLAACGPEWARAPTWPPCLIVGVLTVVFPMLVMQPAMGGGVASSKAADPAQARLRSLVTHAVFGVGLYLAARCTALLA
ncbi:MAG TPA: DUF2938 domain-containing protein [Luteimonas sp.]|nr:DUF2938 domain-containing protein [Luteimonas sp.]